MATKIGDTRWLIAQQIGQGTPKAFVALLVFWLALFAQFWFVCAAQPTLRHLDLVRAGCGRSRGNVPRIGAWLWRPVRISPEPMRKAVKTLEAKPSNQNAP